MTITVHTKDDGGKVVKNKKTGKLEGSIPSKHDQEAPQNDNPIAGGAPASLESGVELPAKRDLSNPLESYGGDRFELPASPVDTANAQIAASVEASVLLQAQVDELRDQLAEVEPELLKNMPREGVDTLYGHVDAAGGRTYKWDKAAANSAIAEHIADTDGIHQKDVDAVIKELNSAVSVSGYRAQGLRAVGIDSASVASEVTQGDRRGTVEAVDSPVTTPPPADWQEKVKSGSTKEAAKAYAHATGYKNYLAGKQKAATAAAFDTMSKTPGASDTVSTPHGDFAISRGAHRRKWDREATLEATIPSIAKNAGVSEDQARNIVYRYAEVASISGGKSTFFKKNGLDQEKVSSMVDPAPQVKEQV